MTNISPLIDEHLSQEQLRVLRGASELAATNGVELYLVGGTVRDLMLGFSPLDIDMSVVNAPEGFDSMLAAKMGGEVKARSQFGTSKLDIGGVEIDLAMARKESYEHPGALPIVGPSTIDEDLARRDFSINAMAASLNTDSWGELTDLFDGENDLRNGVVRVLHSNSFVDDATRLLRAVRYAGRLGFSLDDDTERLMKRDLGYLDTISGDRIRHEFERIFHEDDAMPILSMAQESGILSAIYPPLTLDDGIVERISNLDKDDLPANELFYVSILAYCTPAYQHEGLIKRLNMGSVWAKVVRDTAALKSASEQLREPDIPNSRVYAILKPFEQAALQVCALAASDSTVSRRIELYLSKLSHVRGLLDGGDIKTLGVPEGPEIGRLLKDILDAKLNGLLHSRKDEEGFVMRRVMPE